MPFVRSSGILLHLTSLPGRWGIGDLGPEAYRFVDFLVAAGQRLWQILPFYPTGYGDSPYQCLSAFAGNPLLISPALLVEDGLLAPDDLPAPVFPDGQVDYAAVIGYKLPLLRRSFEYFRHMQNPDHVAAFADFCAAAPRWLDDYALFAALKEHHHGAAWYAWEPKIAARRPDALAHWKRILAESITVQKYIQFVFLRQWKRLKAYANQRGVELIGDVPFLLAHDNADVWANQHMFYLDDQGQPTVVAGVPPDFFRPTGQRWGNVIYRWERMAETGYSWWVNYITWTLGMVDVARLDHFRGFESYWEVPASEPTAVNGRWVRGPGAALFDVLERRLGRLPVIAEDLGMYIPPEVEALRKQFGFPGMKVLQFAFTGDEQHPFLPHNYLPDYVVYTGTHDYNTVRGWFELLSQPMRERVLGYLGRDSSDLSWDLIRLALASVADLAIIPLQDLLRLGSEACLNRPGQVSGNWTWRFREADLTPALAQQLRQLTLTYGRLGESA